MNGVTAFGAASSTALGQMNGTVCLLLITAIMIIILHPQPNDQDVIKLDILWILFVHLKTEIGETQIKFIDFIERCCLI